MWAYLLVIADVAKYVLVIMSNSPNDFKTTANPFGEQELHTCMLKRHWNGGTIVTYMEPATTQLQ
jgi:hypothetical protein